MTREEFRTILRALADRGLLRAIDGITARWALTPGQLRQLRRSGCIRGRLGDAIFATCPSCGVDGALELRWPAAPLVASEAGP